MIPLIKSNRRNFRRFEKRFVNGHVQCRRPRIDVVIDVERREQRSCRVFCHVERSRDISNYSRFKERSHGQQITDPLASARMTKLSPNIDKLSADLVENFFERFPRIL